MTSRSLLILALLFGLWSPNAVAHDVPDRVQVSIFLNPEPGRMVVLVRLPANALIDFLLPTLPDSNWLDLKNTDSVVNEAAKVWIADRLVLCEDGVALPKPRVLAVRLSRVNDPSFRNYESALDHLHADPLPTDTLVLQDQVTVDALLEAPIHLPGADFSFAPEFGRLGVLVFTTLLFLPEDGGVRKFSYEGDPPTFHLDATRAKALRNFVSAGFEHVLGDRESLLFLFCVALTFLRIRPVIHFALVMLSGEALSVIACLSFSISATWLPVLSAALVAAIAVYMGIEAIVAVQSKRVGAALIAGAILGCAFWSALQSDLQFAGTHALTASFGYLAGAIASQLLALALALGMSRLLLRLSLAPRAMIIIAAAVVIHVSWRTMLDQAATMTLVSSPDLSSHLLPIAGVGIGFLACALWIASKQRMRARSAVEPIA